MTRRLSIVGSTASGKSTLAASLARRISSIELVSVDAIALYRELDIGTAKPSVAERAELSWHLVDLVDPDEEFSVKAFQEEAQQATSSIAALGGDIVTVGGTGLYHRAVVDGLEIPGQFPAVREELERQAREEGLAQLYARLVEIDPLAATRLLPTNERRLLRALEVCLGEGRPFSSFGPGLSVYSPSAYRIVGIDLSRRELDQRIACRLDEQFDAGFLAEVEGLVSRYSRLSRTAAQAIGYRELIAHLNGECSLEDAKSEILRRTRAFSRRQLSWFRRDPRITWIDGARPDALDVLTERFLEPTSEGNVGE